MKRATKFAIAIVVALTLSATALFGCTQSDRVSHNISKDADNFNQVRQVTVLNCIQGETLFQMTGKMSINEVRSDTRQQLEIIVEDENGEYKKHFVGLSDNVTYVVEDITSDDVSKYHYTLNFNPELWIPVDVKTID